MNYKISLGLALIAVLIGASVATVYFSEASINYSLNPYLYQKISNQWHTIDIQNKTSFPETFTIIYSQNKGSFGGAFGVIVKLTNATFSQNSYQPSQYINSNTIKLSYNLRSQEKNYTNVYFTINNNATQFVISIAFQTNQLLIRHTEANWGGQNEYPYDYWENNTWAPIQIA